MKSSESVKELAAALAKAQASMENASKDTANPFFKSKYANLESVVGVIRPAIEKHGLSFVQVCHDWDAGAKVETIILHESGEWLSCGVMAAPATKADAQGFGSALTYARRYSLSAAFGVATEDDDGNAASKNRHLVSKVNEVELAGFIVAIKEAQDVTSLQGAYKAAYKAAANDKAAQESVIAAKDARKLELMRAAA